MTTQVDAMGTELERIKQPDLRSRLDYYYEKAEAAEVFFEAW